MTGTPGAEETTVKVAEVEVPPPGFVAVIAYVPAVAKSVGDNTVVSCDDETNVVLRANPLMLTIDPDSNPLPLTVSVRLVPATTEVGEMLEIVGVP